jgi:hypothetical protein
VLVSVSDSGGKVQVEHFFDRRGSLGAIDWKKPIIPTGMMLLTDEQERPFSHNEVRLTNANIAAANIKLSESSFHP